MDWIQPLLDWAVSNDTLLWWLFAASLVLLAVTPLVVVVAVVQLPPDYFSRKRRRPLDSWRHPVLRPNLLIAKNLLGAVLFVAGIVMLLVPGQGLLTIAVALVLLDFPGKFRLERWLATRPAVWRSLNWLRMRGGRRPFEKGPGREGLVRD
jgi:hypothetical protein